MTSWDPGLLQQVVFPRDVDMPGSPAEMLPLYVRTAKIPKPPKGEAPARLTLPSNCEVLSRTSVRIAAFTTATFDTYFNRLHASYWRTGLGLSSTEIRVQGEGRATLNVFRSTREGRELLELSRPLGEQPEGLSVVVDLSGFGVGGCIWFEIETGAEPFTLTEAQFRVGPGWESDRPASAPTVDVAITTFNHPHDVGRVVSSLVSEPSVDAVLSTVWVVDNGDSHLEEIPETRALMEHLGDRLRVIQQRNIGGSGGFARSMYEAVRSGRATHLLLMDDDVLAEPESVRRAISFASLSPKPVAVGGHMLNRAAPRVLHSSGEWVDTHTMSWGPAPNAEWSVPIDRERLDLRIEVGYNGWWACLIPTSVIREIGLPMPFFIKWDDVEYGYRMAEHDVDTVTLPGFAVWHEPWDLKDDTTDWTLFFHIRNRLIAAALFSADVSPGLRRRRVLRILRDVMRYDILRNIGRRAYASADSAVAAMEAFLRGPTALQQPLDELLADVRGRRRGFPDSGSLPIGDSGEDFYTPEVTTPLRVLRPFLIGLTLMGELGLDHPFRRGGATTDQVNDPWRLDGGTGEHRKPLLPKSMDTWLAVGREPAVFVATVEGSAATLREQRPDTSRELLARAISTARQVLDSFESLSREYAAAHAELTSEKAWLQQFRIDESPATIRS
jgi:galactofuranosylgalactofuranosylrhamnosyl-N-acetylglucosaminyl-diphospho-decaprenol beta-1,5/1,6-galactofuranosyltransferase